MQHTCKAAIGWVILAAAASFLPPPLSAQNPPTQQNPANAKAMEIIAAWQNSSKGATPAARAELIGQALKLALAADPWPFQNPSRDSLIGQMWGQLGNELRRIEGPDAPATRERALQAYAQALKHVPRERESDWARVQYGLAFVYIDRVQGERADNIERAIAAFGNVAQVMTREKAPALWADVKIGLAKAYWFRLAGSRADNLEQAIAEAEAALTVISRDKAAADWAAAQQALGAAYWGRVRGSRVDNIEKALSAYELALAALSMEKQPKAWAGTQDNIGMAYAVRVRGERAENITRAAAAFEQAGRVFTRQSYPFDWAQLELNFANLLHDAAKLAAANERTEAAIQRYESALTVYTPQAFPERHARVMLNLGTAYADRARGDRIDFERAIAAGRAALHYYSRDNDAFKWASAQVNLASAMRRRSGGSRARNLEDAAAAYDAALTVLTPDAFPSYNMRAAANAGAVAALRGEWARASSYYRQAIDASVRLFGQGLAAADAKLVLEDGDRMFTEAAYAEVRQDRPARALDIVETGRARLLRVALGLDALTLTSDERAKLDGLRRQIQEIEGTIEQVTGSERLAAIQALEKLRREIGALVQQGTSEKAGDPTRSSGSALAARLITRFDAIAMPLVTETGSALLLVTRGKADPDIKAVPMPGADAAAFERLLIGDAPLKQAGGWLGAYQINSLPAEQQTARRPEWESAVGGLEATLGTLVGGHLGAALDSASLPDNARLLWLPQGGLGLLPIGVAATGKGRLADRYSITIAPSLAAAAVAGQRFDTKPAAPSLAAIVNPTGDLASTEPEGFAAASYFKGSTRKLGAGQATREAVLAALAKASHWHFATHGRFTWAQPRQSALALANGEALTMGDLLDRTGIGTPRLVVLSACETGIFDFQRTPDEFTGLPLAFLQAGAAGVVASLWPVDDVSTALLMMRFYDRHLGAGAPPATALQQAQSWMRDATRADLTAFVADMTRAGRLQPVHATTLIAAITATGGADMPYAHPLFWAAFEYYGG